MVRVCEGRCVPELSHDLALGAGTLLGDVDLLAERMFEVLAATPGLLPPMTPDLARIGIAVARADLAHELHCLADGAVVPSGLPHEVEETARRTVALGAPLTFPLQCYRTGHQVLWDAWRAWVATQPSPVQDALLTAGSDFFFAYADWASVALAAAHGRLLASASAGLNARHLEQVRAVLAGAATPTSIGSYHLARSHVAVVLSGDDADAMAVALTAASGRQALRVDLDVDTVWLWLSTTRPPAIPPGAPEGLRVGVGPATTGQKGFARSHRSAQQALRHALLTGAAAASYDDVALDALCHVDLQQADDFALHALAPLVEARNADVLCGTLAAWTAAGLRAEDAASALCVSTRTVLNRLASAGELLGHHPRELATELDIALRISAHTQTRGTVARGQNRAEPIRSSDSDFDLDTASR